MRIEPFGVEQWMNEFENECDFNLAETCVDSLTVGELLAICDLSPAALVADLAPVRLGYGAIPGSDRLRQAIAALYGSVSADRVLVTHGAIGANALVHQAVVEPGDEVVSFVPNYQQHYSIPESLGARVTRLVLRPEDAYLPDLDRLASVVSPRTKLIAFSNPNNPTGSLMPETMLRDIAGLAERFDAWVLSDEVYRGTDQTGSGTTTSMADISPRGIATGSMSKAFSLAGLRLGWVTAPADLVETLSEHRDYTTISVGMIDDHLASLALEHADAILARSRALTRRNLTLLTSWVDAHPSLRWLRPRSGTTALVHYGEDVPSRAFCVRLLQETGVMFTPGSVLGVEGAVRIGFANATTILEAGLAAASPMLSVADAATARGAVRSG